MDPQTFRPRLVLAIMNPSLTHSLTGLIPALDPPVIALCSARALPCCSFRIRLVGLFER